MGGVVQRQFLSQKIHDHLIISPAVYYDLPSKPTDELEFETLADVDGPFDCSR